MLLMFSISKYYFVWIVGDPCPSMIAFNYILIAYYSDSYLDRYSEVDLNTIYVRLLQGVI